MKKAKVKKAKPEKGRRVVINLKCIDCGHEMEFNIDGCPECGGCRVYRIRVNQ
jgi:ferredoxin-like protein FixX